MKYIITKHSIEVIESPFTFILPCSPKNERGGGEL